MHRAPSRARGEWEDDMPRTSLDLVPPWMSPEQLRGSYTGSILHMAQSQAQELPMLERVMDMLAGLVAG